MATEKYYLANFLFSEGREEELTLTEKAVKWPRSANIASVPGGKGYQSNQYISMKNVVFRTKTGNS